MSIRQFPTSATSRLRLRGAAVVISLFVALAQGVGARPCCEGEAAGATFDAAIASGDTADRAEIPGHQPGHESGESPRPSDDACSCCVLVAVDFKEPAPAGRTESTRLDAELAYLPSSPSEGLFRPPRLA